jgi:transposase-like protein
MPMTTSIPDIPILALPRPKQRVTRSRAQWQSLVEKFNTSGLTKTAFCKRHGIAASCFYRWQKVLAEENTQDAFVDITEPVATARSIDRAPEYRNDWQVELELGAGVILRVRTG